MTRQMILDITSLAHWSGSPVGILRVEHELAQYARGAALPVTFSMFDKERGQFRRLRDEYLDSVAGFSGFVAMESMVTALPRQGWRRWVPGRQGLVMALEQRRLAARNPALAKLCDLAQRALLAVKAHQFPLYDQHGQRLPVLTQATVLAEEIILRSDVTLLTAGVDWYHKDVARLVALKQRYGFRLAAVCYDILPITHPEWFPVQDAALFRRYWEQILQLADVVIVNSQAVARDVREFCGASDIALRSLRVVPLGSAPPVPVPATSLPHGLRAGHYALFVSTVEPRKGHGLLLEVWQRLAAAGVLQARDFHLVLVGRQGWHVEREIQAIAALTSGGRVRHFIKADDNMVATLMAGAAFCVYPSRSEGFGLPVIEAFGRGKAVLCSSGGSLPEVAGDLAPCIDPYDSAAWEAMLRQWIEQPKLVSVWEEKIRQGFTLRRWDQVAADVIFAALDQSDTASGVNQ